MRGNPDRRFESAAPAKVLAVPGRLLNEHGPLLAALAAAAAALPGLWLPFLADDWALLDAVKRGSLVRTPFGYFRPLCMATFLADLRLWGLSPALFHLTNLVLIALSSALLVLVIRQLTRDPGLAGLAGLLFAIHPYHVENAAWIAGRADPLFTLFFLCALLAYDRWRKSPRGLPLLALLLFEAALLAKEAAVSLPLLLLVIGLCDRDQRPGAPELARGILPLLGVALGHFLLLRPAALGGPGFAPPGGFGTHWLRNLFSFATASLLPAHIEFLETRPRLWGALALLALMVPIAAARLRSGRIPPLAWGGAAAFAVLLAPSLLSFQARYFFLPSAASALALACLLLACGRKSRAVLAALLCAGWILALGAQWNGWSEAGHAGSRLIGDLAEASREPGVKELVVANMPYRVHGTAVAGNLPVAVALSGGRPVTLRPVLSLDYPDDHADALTGLSRTPTSGDWSGIEIRLRIREGVFSRYVHPVPGTGPDARPEGKDTVEFGDLGAAIVTLHRADDGTRAGFVWRNGRLERLF